MTATIQTTNLIGVGTQFTFAAAGDSFYLFEGVLVANTDATTTINGATSDLNLSVDGSVVAGGDAIAVRLTGGDSVLSIGSTGVIRSNESDSANTVVFIAAGNNALVNDGLIAGERTIGILAAGGDNEITNSGTIIGATGLLLGLFSGVGDRLVNSGRIVATDVNPNGSVRYNHGVQAEGNNTEIVNLAGGEIIAHAATGAGVSVGDTPGVSSSGDGSTVTNHGSITSVQFWGVDFANMDDAETATLTNFGLIQGGTGAFRGNATGETIRNGGQMIGDVDLGGGNDTFDGRGGTVEGEVRGGAGDDIFFVDDPTLNLVEVSGEGFDVVYALTDWTLGDHFDDLVLLGGDDLDGTGNDLDNIMNGNTGNNRLDGGTDNDTIDGGAGDDTLLGGGGRDSLAGGQGDDTLRGQSGLDTLEGGDGNDVLAGNAGMDNLSGNEGNDTLIGGAGSDTLSGGSNSDLFLFRNQSDSANDSGWDRITDFNIGEDLIDLSRLVQGEIDFLGTGVFTATGQAEIRVLTSGGGANSRLRIDLDGDGNSDMRIDVIGETGLSATDFLL